MGVPLFQMVTFGLLPSPIKKMIYRLRGAKIGKRVRIGIGTVLNTQKLEIGDDVVIGPGSFLNVRTLKLGNRVHIKMLVAIDTPNVVIGDDSVIMEQVVVGGMVTPRSILMVGKRVKIFPFSFLNPTEPIWIEDEASIGGDNAIFTHATWQSMLDGFPIRFAPVHIKKGAWLPWRVLVTPGVTIGECATIGACSLVNKDVPDRTLVAGAPARVIKQGSEYIASYSPEQKKDMVLRILDEWTQYSEFLDGTVISDVQYSQESRVWEVMKKRRKYAVGFYSQLSRVAREDVLVILGPVNADLQDKLCDQKKIWFDVLGKKTSYVRHALWGDMRNFFSRYGIRFEVV